MNSIRTFSERFLVCRIAILSGEYQLVVGKKQQRKYQQNSKTIKVVLIRKKIKTLKRQILV